MAAALDSIKAQFDRGEVEGARSALVHLLAASPENTVAWVLLTSLFDDPAQQAGCYRQILSIDPNNRQAAARLMVLASRRSEPGSTRQPPKEDGPVLRCPQCGGPLETDFYGEIRNKRLECPYCGTQIDLPDTFSRVQQTNEYQNIPWENRKVEESGVETRFDGQLGQRELEALPSEVRQILRLLIEKGPEAIDSDLLQRLQQNGINVSLDPLGFDPDTLQTLLERGFELYDGPPLPSTTRSVVTWTAIPEAPRRGLSALRRKRRQKSEPLSPNEIIALAGGPLPLDQRRTCPNPKCGATISKSATTCPWCGVDV
jgi:hypothetical protein